MKKSKEQVLEILNNSDIKLATVSGVFTTKPNIIKYVDENIPQITVITTKSFQVVPNSGNREPIIIEEVVGCFGNAVGLRNPGMDKAYDGLKRLRENHNLKAILNVSLSASSVSDFIVLVKKFEDIADTLELNFSCPHAKEGFGASIGTDKDIVSEYIKEIRSETDALIFPKLTPNVENIGEIAKAAVDAGADGIVAINTVGPECYKEPNSNQPILYNPKGNKGGKSGEWIKDIAISKIKEIRVAVGENIPIIGMGGVTYGSDVKDMINAGANVVGIGSAIARVDVNKRSDYFKALVDDAKNNTHFAKEFISDKRLAKYKEFKIENISQVGDDLRIFELSGNLDYDASQFVFLWIPGVGEKPFSVAKSEPLTFVIRKRGEFTNAAFELKEGDNLYVRGVYGKCAPISEKKKAYIITGGTGVAVVPKLAKKLHDAGKEVFVYFGITTEAQGNVLKDEIEKYAQFFPVADTKEVRGMVLKKLESDLSDDESESCFYNVGPVPLMKFGMDIQLKKGAGKKDIFASIETNNMCGIGMCSECECGGVLTCQDGTFFSLDYLESKNLNIMDM